MKIKLKQGYKQIAFLIVAIFAAVFLIVNTGTFTQAKAATTAKAQIKIHYINVGQGDSELIQQGGKNMLIDAGTNASTKTLIAYLKKQGVKKIDYFILTHPHEDHVGGADTVINTFSIGIVYMPKVTTTTATFKDVVTAMNKKKLKATVPTQGATFKLGSASCMILGPINTNKEDLNTYSIVLKLTFGNNKFMFTGDAQMSNEQDMITKRYDLSADVLKVGHHGSHTSTSQAFLDKVDPEYAVISCGKGNDYGHPHKETMQKLQAKKISVYRTDECGTIVCTSDGKSISFSTKPGDYKYGSSAPAKTTTPSKSSTTKQTNNNTRVVYWTPNGKSYHYSKSCSTLKRSKTILSGPLNKCPKKDPCDKCVH